MLSSFLPCEMLKEVGIFWSLRLLMPRLKAVMENMIRVADGIAHCFGPPAGAVIAY